MELYDYVHKRFQYNIIIIIVFVTITTRYIGLIKQNVYDDIEKIK